MKRLKPIDLDAYFKYRCPNDDCGYYHWLSLKEVQTKNFKIVCDCGLVSIPKQINKIKISYTYTSHNKTTKQASSDSIPIDLETKCVKLLLGYGFLEKEAISMVRFGFEKNSTTDAGSLIKYILTHLGELNVNY